jgi:hypothetical protein
MNTDRETRLQNAIFFFTSLQQSLNFVWLYLQEDLLYHNNVYYLFPFDSCYNLIQILQNEINPSTELQQQQYSFLYDSCAVVVQSPSPQWCGATPEPWYDQWYEQFIPSTPSSWEDVKQLRLQSPKAVQQERVEKFVKKEQEHLTSSVHSKRACSSSPVAKKRKRVRFSLSPNCN